jgi:hypothetical protein
MSHIHSITKQSQAQTKHFYARVEIKTKKGQNIVWLSNPKGLLNPKLAIILPHGATPKCPYPFPLPSPFHVQVKFL